MIRTLSLLILPCLLAVGFVACGDDDPPLTPINENFEFKSGDTYTYKYYDRDSTNTRVETSQQVFIWTVLRTDLDTLAKTSVAEIEEVRYDATGTNESGRSKIYMKVDVDGQVLIYNLVGTVLNRFSGAIDLSLYLDQVPKTWIIVGNTNDASARVLMNDSLHISQTLNNVVLPLVDPFDAKLNIGVRTNHLGAVAVSVAAGNYDKAYATDTKLFVKISNIDELVLPFGTFPAGTTILQDSIRTHYDIDIDAGVLRQNSDSKIVQAVNGLVPVTVNGFEMELQSFTRAATAE